MTNSILIGKAIYGILSADNEIQSYVNGRVYPLIAEQSSKFPFIVYWRNSIQATSISKDGFSEDTVNFNVVIISDDYSDTLLIANRVRKILEVRKIFGNDMILYNTRMTDIDESWSENSYVQTLSFTCTVK